MKIYTLKPQYKGAILTIQASLQNSLPFGVTFDTNTCPVECYANMVALGFREAFNEIPDAGASEVIRHRYWKP
jgi:hypothetical protein